MVCEVCGKTIYWCLGHPPYHVEVTQSGDPS